MRNKNKKKIFKYNYGKKLLSCYQVAMKLQSIKHRHTYCKARCIDTTYAPLHDSKE